MSFKDKVVDRLKEVKVEVMGPEPPCVRCQSVKKVVDKVALKLAQNGMTVYVEKVNIMSKDVVRKYGVLISPAVAVDGVVRIMGRVPAEGDVEKLILEAASKV